MQAHVRKPNSKRVIQAIGPLRRKAAIKARKALMQTTPNTSLPAKSLRLASLGRQYEFGLFFRAHPSASRSRLAPEVPDAPPTHEPQSDEEIPRRAEP